VIREINSQISKSLFLNLHQILVFEILKQKCQNIIFIQRQLQWKCKFIAVK